MAGRVAQAAGADDEEGLAAVVRWSTPPTPGRQLHRPPPVLTVLSQI